jgi:hypothetical protein
MRSALCVMMASLMVGQAAFAQAPQNAPKPATPEALPLSLNLSVIEGNNAINSIPLGRSVTPVVEVRDQNDFPVEGATVVFVLPEHGPGGTFLKTPTTFTTLSDSHGQAAAPFLINSLPGRFQIQVTATAGNRRGEAVITQTNTTGGYIGPALPQRSWYKKWPTWAIIGGAVAAGVVVWAVSRNSGATSSQTVTITPGAPVFH